MVVFSIGDSKMHSSSGNLIETLNKWHNFSYYLITGNNVKSSRTILLKACAPFRSGFYHYPIVVAAVPVVYIMKNNKNAPPWC